jgi:hypothetical protein
MTRLGHERELRAPPGVTGLPDGRYRDNGRESPDGRYRDSGRESSGGRRTHNARAASP